MIATKQTLTPSAIHSDAEHLEVFMNHAQILACPHCHLAVAPSELGVNCTGCGAEFQGRNGLIDFAPEIPRSSVKEQPGAAQRYMEDGGFIDAYLESRRAQFVRIMGHTRGAGFTLEDEYAYINEFVRPAEGAVLDLACGPGQYTQALIRKHGAERTLGLDLSFSMLEAASKVAPGALFLRGSALAMPIRDASLGAVLCWNALQLLPDPRKAVSEIGRCLRPGGTFTCFTYRKATGPYRIIQRGWEMRMRGVHAIEGDRLRCWLRQAGLVLTDMQGPSLVLRFSAIKS
jgi:SAM-dependent methyltransferase